MLQSTKQGLQNITNAFRTTAEEYDININIKKTKAMVISKKREKVLARMWMNKGKSK